MNHINSKIQKVFAVVCLLTIMSGPIAPIASFKTANAQGTVPVNTMFNFHSIQDHLKTFTLDRLAVMAANQILQKMTASVVNWINTGFQGNPTFLTDPEGFFLDIGDQLTGQFLYELGVPGVVCEPFGLDLRIGIAMNQAYGYMPRYTCTLGTVIGNTMDAIDRGVSIDVVNDPYGLNLGKLTNPSADLLNDPNSISVNNAGMREFMRGDFRYGGWPGFLAMTMQPQNNPNMAYLQAQADLENRIAARRAQINSDLDRGSGFLSFEKCQNVTMNDLQYDYGINDREMATLGKSGALDVNWNNQRSTVKRKINTQTGAVSYQSCETQTPGSVIGGTLQRQLNVPQDKLVLVKTISDSIDAVLGALVNQMLSQGLASLSKRGSGYSGNSYLRSLALEADSRNSTDARLVNQRLKDSYNSFLAMASSSANMYDDSINKMNEVKAEFISAQACLEGKVSELDMNTQRAEYTAAETRIANIRGKIFSEVDPAILTYTNKKAEIEREASEFYTATDSLTGNESVPVLTSEYINQKFGALETIVNASTNAAKRGADQSMVSFEKQLIKAKIDALKTEATAEMAYCTGFPGRY